MKAIILASLLAFSSVPALRAEQVRFFRIAGPVTSKITAISADGYITWTNTLTNATFTVQTAQSLLSPITWMDYIQGPGTNGATTLRLFDPHPPAGMTFIPAGSFTLGDSLDGDAGALPLHTVQVSALYMDRLVVTKALWDDVYNWALTNGYSFDHGAEGKGPSHPAQSMPWYDAVKWCNARSERERRVPAYYTSPAQTTVYRTGQVAVDNNSVRWNSGYRLPTEAEWEKAARGGARGHRFPWRDSDTIDQTRANYYSFWVGGAPYYPYDTNPFGGAPPAFHIGPAPYTSPVDYFAPNGYELYDMAGNVFEWCWDWFASYSSASQTDPHGAATGTNRILRGGSWFSDAIYCRVAERTYDVPSIASFDYGFRSVLPAGP